MQTPIKVRRVRICLWMLCLTKEFKQKLALFEGLEVLPSYTKIDKDTEVTVTFRNKDSKSLLKIPEGIEMVTVTSVGKE